MPVDYGDSDLPYTLRIENGARHVIVGPTLADAADWEHDGQPTPDATGDGDDENGVVLLDWLGQPTTQLVPGEVATVVFTVGAASTENAYLYAWIDYNNDGDWTDSGTLIQSGVSIDWSEQIAEGELITPGQSREFQFLVPNVIQPGEIHARFRIIGETEYVARDPADTGWTLGFDGVAYSGEVEDYQFEVLSVDYGDMPDPYTLWTDDGARHVIAGPYLAGLPDHNYDGQPGFGALGDDFDNDGSTALTSADLVPGNPHLTAGGVLGVRRSLITIDPAGVCNTFQIYAPNGVDGIGVVFVAGATESTVWDGLSQMLTVNFIDGDTTVNDVIALINAVPVCPLLAEVVDDEQGVVLLDSGGDATSKLIPGEWAWVEVTADPASTEVSHLYAWINFDGDDVWGTSGTATRDGLPYSWSERIAEDVTIQPGATVLVPFFVPYDISASTVSARFRVIGQTEHDARIASDANWTLPVDGVAYSGEVEDYQFLVLGFDYGDADMASTLWSYDGARHLIDSDNVGPVLQSTSPTAVGVDAEADGIATPMANGDDTSGGDDEDGVSFFPLLMPGEPAWITVSTANASGWLDGWIDYDRDGVFQADEYLFGQQGQWNVSVSAGTQTFAISVPADAVPGATYARFRVSSEGQLSPDGLAYDGEVEDYRWVISEMDYGDAASSYRTARAVNGPRHVIAGPSLGNADHDVNGVPTVDATGDDFLDGNDDEAGVTLGTLLIPGEQAQVAVSVVGSGYLDAWFDFNHDGNWGQMVDGSWVDDSGERVFSGLVSGPSLLYVTVPQTAVPGNTIARFRIQEATAGAMTPLGLAYSGEVEDHLFTVEQIDYGDAATDGDDTTAPSFPTLRAQNGARHVIDSNGPYLGTSVDHDVDGAPTTVADGDDRLDGNDDEDGVSFSSLFWVGNTDPALDPKYSIVVNTGDADAFVDVWIDFNGDGVWNSSEQVLDLQVPQNSIPIVLGGSLSIPDPDPANRYTGYSYARVRVSSTDMDLPDGLAYDGEVEDYQIYLDAAPVANAGGPYRINTDQDLRLDGSKSTDADIPPDAIVWYQWDFTYDPSLAYDPADERTYFHPEFETQKAIDSIPWPWVDIIKVPQPRPEGAFPIYLRVVDSFGAESTVKDSSGEVVEGAMAELYIYDNQPHAVFEVTDATGGSPATYAPEQVILFDDLSWHDRAVDKQLVMYEWDFDYNGTFSADQILTAGSGDTSHFYNKFGTYTAVLRVTDSNSPAKTSTYSQTISVTAGNIAPLADAGGPYTINIGQSAAMDGGASMYDAGQNPNPASWGDSIVKWQWDLNDDGVYDVQGKEIAVSWAQLTALVPQVAIPAANEGYAWTDVTLRVEDSLGKWDTVKTQLYVHENQPHAEATASPLTIAPGAAVAFDGTNSWHDRNRDQIGDHLRAGDPHPDRTWGDAVNRSIVTYEWDLHYDGSFNPEAATATLNYTGYTQFGTYQAMLRVTDNNSPARRDFLDQAFTIVVNQGDVLPVANPGGPYRVAVGNGVVLDASASIDGNLAAGDAITTYKWTLLRPGQPDLEILATSPTYSMTAADLNSLGLTLGESYELKLQVQDKEIPGIVTADWSVVAATTLSIHDNDVFATLVVTNDDNMTVACGFELAFDAGGSYNPHPDHDIVTYEWDFDYDGVNFVPDPAAGTLATSTHAFGQFGTYRVAVRATDDAGKSDIAEVTINVSEGNNPPAAKAGGPSLYLGEAAYFLDVNQSLTLDASASSDPDVDCGDSIVSYQWDLDSDGQFDDAVGVHPTLSWASLQALGVAGLGPHTIGLQVADEFGVTDTDSSQFVIFTNQPTAAINIDDEDGQVGRTTKIDFYGIDSAFGTGSTAGRPDRQIVKYEWDLDGDGAYEVVQSDPLAAGFGVVNDVTFPMFQLYTVSLRVTDNNSPARTDTASIVITVNEGNQAPHAVVSVPAIIEMGEGITLDGSDSADPDAAFGDAIVSYAWTIDGKQLLIDEPTVALTADDLTGLALSDPDAVVVTLTVTDKFGNQDTDEATFAISDNQPNAVFTALPNPVACNTAVEFNASESENPHPNFDIVRYEWDFNYDGSFDADAEGEETTHRFSQFGEYEVALRVTDNNVPAKTDIFTVIVSVSLGNRAPVADAGGPYVFTTGQAIVVDASQSTDPDQDCGDSIAAYRWDLDNDGQFDDASGVTVTIPASSLIPDQPRTIRLQVEDSQGGLLSVDTTTVTLTTNAAPVADAGGPYTGSEGTSLVLNGTGSSDDVAVVGYEWDLDYNGTTFAADVTGVQPSVTFDDDIASRTIALRVTDAKGLSHIDTTTITIGNADPVAGGVTVAPSNTIGGAMIIGSGQSVTVSGSFTDLGVLDTHTVVVDWNDGTTSNATVDQEAGTFEATHTFAGVGQYTITATVADDDDGSAQATVIVSVADSLGTVDFRDDLTDLDPSDGDLWFVLTAAHNAFLTVELGGAGATAATALLYDADGILVSALANGPSDGADYLVDADDSYYLKLSGTAADVDLRLTNLVSVDGSAVTVLGTDQDDAFEFELTAGRIVRINGTRYQFADVTGVAETFNFDGGDGTDSATFTGSEAVESARFFTGAGEFFSGSETYDGTGFFVEAAAENLIAFSGGGRDFAKMYDSPGDDLFTSSPATSTLVGVGYSHAAHNFYSAHGYATNRTGSDRSGGNDHAIMHDSEGKDKLKVDWADAEQFFGKLYGGNYYTRAKNFEIIDAASTGGNDLAVVIASPGNDELYLKQGVGRITNDQTEVEFLGFNTVIASAGAGYDIVRLEDTAGDDEMRGRSHKTLMTGPGYSITARYFDEVYAEAKNGGDDKAKFHPTAADDILHAREVDGKAWAQLAVDGATEDLLYEALGFDLVRAYESDGNDKVDRTEEFDWLLLDGDWTDL